MASIHTVTLPHYPSHPIHIALFQNVRNAAHLRAQLLSANPDYDYAFLDATTIFSYHQLLLAAQLALQAHLSGRSKTRTPHSELVFRLHSNNNIGESYRKFGIEDSSTALVAVKFSLSPETTTESVSKHLGEAVEGESVAIGENGEELSRFADLGKIRKIFKLNDGGKGKKGAVVNGEAKDERKELESVILGTMALKGS